ncbi:MAG TPA: thioesterase family protein [Bacteroidia bacterium]|nr:thioesterase family protein [Bacteroidia bacterium]
MFISEVQIRVRYAETDQMGYVYYGNYAAFFEVGRVEALRALGFSYRKLENAGYMLPVMNYNIDYLKPAHYDDLLTIKTSIPLIPSARIHFEYETYNEQEVLINKASTTLVFIDRASNKPCKPPQDFLQAISKYF